MIYNNILLQPFVYAVQLKDKSRSCTFMSYHVCQRINIYFHMILGWVNPGNPDSTLIAGIPKLDQNGAFIET